MEISVIADIETIEKDFPKNNSPTCPGICICEDPFRALQIDNEYGIGNIFLDIYPCRI